MCVYKVDSYYDRAAVAMVMLGACRRSGMYPAIVCVCLSNTFRHCLFSAVWCRLLQHVVGMSRQ